jgi:predicted molibdopterin-dependent oxidoreductase YjgC
VKDDVAGGRVISVSSDAKAPVNGDHLCVKGRYGYDFIQSPNRVKQPRVRKYLLEGAPRPVKRGPWVDVDWDTALNIAAQGLLATRERHGPDAIGLLTSGKVLNEEDYLMNKLARQVVGTNNIDCTSHLLRTSVVEGLDASVGVGAMSTSMLDIVRHARSILVLGSNLSENHPVFGVGVRQAVLRRNVQLIAASPTFFNIEEYAALALRYKRGSETAFLNGLMRILLDEGWADTEYIHTHTDGYEDLKATLDEYPPERAAEMSEVPMEQLRRAAEIMSKNRPMAAVWGADLTGQGAEAVRDLANLQMLLGNMGVSGGGLAPLRSQSNSQGAADMGCHPSYYPGYQAAADGSVRSKFAEAWGGELPAHAGLSASAMLAATAAGTLKTLVVLGGNSWADEDGLSVRRSLQKCEFLILCEAQYSDMSHHADVLLPGVSFVETTGTYTNTERRIQLVREAIQPQGDSRPEWKILSELARRMLTQGQRQTPDAPYSGWAYGGTHEIMSEIAALTPIYAGVSHERLESDERLMWPVPSKDHPGTKMLARSVFAPGRERFVPVR